MWHHPRFSTGEHGDDPRVAPLWQALQDARAELVVSGHDHDYERTESINGTVHVVSGGGGARLYKVDPGPHTAKALSTFQFLEVEVDGGGTHRIRVGDDGWGIAPDQVADAFERHATSKLRSEHDLYVVRTLGFRGEALAALAAAADVELTTRPAADDAASVTRSKDGKRRLVPPRWDVSGQ